MIVIMKKEYLEAGKICTAHGVRGALKVEHYCDSAAVLAKQKRVFLSRGGKMEPLGVCSASPSGQFVIMTLEGINSRESAIAERGRIIYLHRDDVPVSRGAMLIADMIGLPVYHAESGAPLGKISEISDPAGRRVYTVLTEGGAEVMLPDVPEFIKEIDEERGMAVLPIPGFFDEADEI